MTIRGQASQYESRILHVTVTQLLATLQTEQQLLISLSGLLRFWLTIVAYLVITRLLTFRVSSNSIILCEVENNHGQTLTN